VLDANHLPRKPRSIGSEEYVARVPFANLGAGVEHEHSCVGYTWRFMDHEDATVLLGRKIVARRADLMPP
jgi:hypothetical protein